MLSAAGDELQGGVMATHSRNTSREGVLGLGAIIDNPSHQGEARGAGPGDTATARRVGQNCHQRSFSIGAHGFSITIPFMNCSSTIEVKPYARKHELKVEWTGETTTQVQLDAAAAYESVAGLTLSFSDYLWWETTYCSTPAGPCIQGQKLSPGVWHDGGWTKS